jgi:hypothetical protein
MRVKAATNRVAVNNLLPTLLLAVDNEGGQGVAL